MSLLNNILEQNTPYELEASEKEKKLLKDIKKSLSFHSKNSDTFNNLILNTNVLIDTNKINQLPYVPARLFKLMDLKSIPDENIFKIMTSSGTSGQAVSKIFLDKESSIMQTRVLNHIVGSYIGKKRRKMLIIDSESIIKDRKKFNARAAGILGFSSFGKNHTYLLDSDLNLDVKKLNDTLEDNGNNPILIFGFTFLVWQKFYQSIKKLGKNLNFPKDTVLIHGGGWKRMHESSVDNTQFKAALHEIGVSNVHDYYGMIEQTGSIFVECEKGHLHCSDYSDVITRDQMTHKPLDFNKEGLLQVISLLPSSYPGNSILTEDIGVILGEDDCECGRKGKYFTISGRMKQSEVRGCSDTRAL